MKLVDLLNSVNTRYEKDVKSICDKWKKKVQEGLKDMMRFGMRPNTSIEFAVNDAYSSGILSLHLTPDELKDYLLFQQRFNIEQLHSYMNSFIKFCSHNIKLIENKSEEYQKYIESTDFIGKVKKAIPENDSFLAKIRNIKEDIFGIYRVKTNNTLYGISNYANVSVNLFWTVIGLFAERYDLNLEALTVTVLSHEYAHAYSHIGTDSNQRNWLTSNFIESDIHIVEGIAEYFSKKFMDANNDSYNNFSETYKKILKMSPAEYQAYEKWKDPSLESIRFAMMELRSNKSCISYDEFVGYIKEGEHRFAKTRG